MTERIDELAKLICVKMGLDPEARVHTDYFGPMTRAEIEVYNAKQAVRGMPLISVNCPQWKLYRKDAELALAVQAATDELRNPKPLTLEERLSDVELLLGRGPTVAELLVFAATYKMTPEEVQAQRESFARHNVSTGDPRLD